MRRWALSESGVLEDHTNGILRRERNSGSEAMRYSQQQVLKTPSEPVNRIHIFSASMIAEAALDPADILLLSR